MLNIAKLRKTALTGRTSSSRELRNTKKIEVDRSTNTIKLKFILFSRHFNVKLLKGDWRFGFLSVKKWRIRKITGVKKEEVKTDGL